MNKIWHYITHKEWYAIKYQPTNHDLYDNQ